MTVVLSSFMSPTHKMGLCCYTAQLYTRPIDPNCSQIQQPFSSPLWPYFSLCETIFVSSVSFMNPNTLPTAGRLQTLFPDNEITTFFLTKTTTLRDCYRSTVYLFSYLHKTSFLSFDLSHIKLSLTALPYCSIKQILLTWPKLTWIFSNIYWRFSVAGENVEWWCNQMYTRLLKFYCGRSFITQLPQFHWNKHLVITNTQYNCLCYICLDINCVCTTGMLNSPIHKKRLNWVRFIS